jgi:hypothetical protein
MATRALRPQDHDPRIPLGKTLISYEEALEVLSREERFMATVSAMNTLLIEKKIYTAEELSFQIRQWAQKQLGRPNQDRIGHQRSS